MRFAPLLLVPVAPALHYLFGIGPLPVFAAGMAGVGVLAVLIKNATEQLAAHTGPAVGGLLSVSLGSLAELILALFVLAAGQASVVHAQITGSILGTGLLGLGLAVTLGGLTRERQTFKRERASLLSSLLILSTVALLTPAMVDATRRLVLHAPDDPVSTEALSLAVSAIVLLLYAGNLLFTLVTHRDVFSTGEVSDPQAWSLPTCLLVLGLATAATAGESELISGEVEQVTRTLGLSPTFMGVVVLAIVGNVADLVAAISFARQDRMGLVMTICIGSAIQVALVLAPLLVVISWVMGRPMTLVFGNPLDLFAIAASALIVNAIAGDGETTWFEGVMLLGVYLVLATAFFFA